MPVRAPGNLGLGVGAVRRLRCVPTTWASSRQTVSNDNSSVDAVALAAEVTRLREALASRQEPPVLSKREALLLKAEAVAHMGSWVWNLRTDEIGWSDEFYRILGLPPGSVEPSAPGFFGAIHPDAVERVQRVAQSSLDEGNPAPVEFRILRPNAEVREVRMEAALVLDDKGERAHLVGTVLDVTERLRSEVLLERTIAELNGAQRAAGMGSWRWDLSHKVEWSAGIYHLFGLKGDEPASEELFFRHVHPDDQERVKAKRHEVLTSWIGLPIELRIVRADGGVREVFMHATALFDRSGALSGFSGVIQDITERKALEAQLRQSQKMEAIGTLAGGVAHDFNNYLMAIAGHAELLLLELPADHRARASVDAIEDAYQRCADLTKQLLTLSRRRRAELQRVDLSSLVSNIAPLLRSMLGETIELRMDIAQSVTIEADPAQVEQVIMNLAVNGRDAMPDGGTLTLSVEEVFVEGGFAGNGAEPQENFVRLSVTDEGHGIEEEVRPRIFEPFFTTKGVGKGTGLGLATAYGIMTEAGGAIEVQSVVGQGSTFHTYWRPSQGEVKTREPSEATTAIQGAGRCVLLVEDVSEVRELLRRQLERAGYRVITATDGVQALQILSDTHVDVVVSDVVMPKMGGVELARRIEAQYRGVPYLLMTGYSADALQGLSDAGLSKRVFERLLRKPFTARQLTYAVGQLVGEAVSHAG